MTDFSFDTEVSRDKMASALSENAEQVPYVLAELAYYVPPGTYTFDELCEAARDLEQEQKLKLVPFLGRLIDAIDT